MKYSLSDFHKDLDVGHEFDLKYKNRFYGISNTDNGICFVRYGYMGGMKTFKDSCEFINEASLNEDLLKNLWDEVEIESIF